MKGRIAVVLTTLLLSFLILFASVLKTASVKYAYSPMVLSEKTEGDNKINIDYALAYQGRVEPDNPLWYVKALRDRALYTVAFDSKKKADLNLLFSDKRLNSSLYLFQKNKPDLGLVTLSKSEKYLELSEKVMGDDKDFYNKLLLASLKHRQVIEEEILPNAPEDLKPEIIKMSDYSKEVYKKVRDHMLSIGMVPLENPFESN